MLHAKKNTVSPKCPESHRRMNVRNETVLAMACAILWTTLSLAGDTNFISSFDAQWCAGNASNILAFTEANVATNASVETLFARAVAAVYVQKWARGATNFLGQAMAMAQGDASLSPGGQSNVVHLLEETKRLFEALADDSNEPGNSVPQWDAAMHAVIFGELGGQAPFLTTLQQITAEQ